MHPLAIDEQQRIGATGTGVVRSQPTVEGRQRIEWPVDHVRGQVRALLPIGEGGQVLRIPVGPEEAVGGGHVDRIIVDGDARDVHVRAVRAEEPRVAHFALRQVDHHHAETAAQVGHRAIHQHGVHPLVPLDVRPLDVGHVVAGPVGVHQVEVAVLVVHQQGGALRVPRQPIDPDVTEPVHLGDPLDLSRGRVVAEGRVGGGAVDHAPAQFHAAGLAVGEMVLPGTDGAQALGRHKRAARPAKESEERAGGHFRSKGGWVPQRSNGKIGMCGPERTTGYGTGTARP